MYFEKVVQGCFLPSVGSLKRGDGFALVAPICANLRQSVRSSSPLQAGARLCSWCAHGQVDCTIDKAGLVHSSLSPIPTFLVTHLLTTGACLVCLPVLGN